MCAEPYRGCYGWALWLAAAATPDWAPEDGLFAYHGLTFGHLAGALISRVSGQGLVPFLQENLLSPLGAEVFIGLPSSADERVAPIVNGDGSTDT